MISLLGAVNAISTRREEVLNRWSEFKHLAAEKRTKLEDAKRLQQFDRNADELEGWMIGKLKLTSEDIQLDSANLEVRLTSLCKHMRSSLGKDQEACCISSRSHGKRKCAEKH